MQEKENLLKILKSTRDAVKEEDVAKLKELSNQTIHSASIYKDTDNITLAVIVYSLGKVIERKYHESSKQCNEFCRSAGLSMERAIAALQNDNEEQFRKNLESIIKSIENLSGNMKLYVKDVFRKARINKASKVYEHGISMEQTAKLLGISLWELAGYAGQKGIADKDKIQEAKAVRKRIKLAMEMFK